MVALLRILPSGTEALRVHPALPIVYSSGKNQRERLVTEVGREGGRGGERRRGREGRGGEQRYTKKLFAGRLNRLFTGRGVWIFRSTQKQ